MRHHTDEHRSLHVNAELSCSLYRKLGPVPRKCYLYGILLRNKTFKSLEKRKATFMFTPGVSVALLRLYIRIMSSQTLERCS